MIFHLVSKRSGALLMLYTPPVLKVADCDITEPKIDVANPKLEFGKQRVILLYA